MKMFSGFRIVLALAIGGAAVALAAPPPLPQSLKSFTPPEPANLGDYVKDKAAAIRLGKALFWDMQLGSDGVQACATCHFNAGADTRSKNQLSPGLAATTPDTTFGNNPFTGTKDFPNFGPNYQMTPADFPFHQLANPDDRNSQVLKDTNDFFTSQGIQSLAVFTGCRINNPRDNCQITFDPVFNVKGINVRRCEPRQAPTMINAIFNATSFWDGRANFYFNGVNPFGPLDRSAFVFLYTAGSLQKTRVAIPASSLASQAVGPPGSVFEMAWGGRSFPPIGKKMLTLVPLGKQKVHPTDSVLGKWSKAKVSGSGLTGLPGLRITYAEMVKAAFKDTWWGDTTHIVKFPASGPVILNKPARVLNLDEYTQMEANFSMFFGLAIQMYESTLVSDDTPFDRYRGTATVPGDPNAMTAQQIQGLDLFMNKGKCINCHKGAVFTSHAVVDTSIQIDPSVPGGLRNIIEPMIMGDGKPAIYDDGIYNTAVRPTAEDICRGATSPIINPKTGQPYPLSFCRLAQLKAQNLVPDEVRQYIPDLPSSFTLPDGSTFVVSATCRVAVDGASKTPGLRNVELMGPQFRNGGQATLRHVMQFYERGGDFHDMNIQDLDPDITDLGLTPAEQDAVVAFMLALTDERVKQEMAPFDHPELLIPNGDKGDQNQVNGSFATILRNGFLDTEQWIPLPAVGAQGRPALGLPGLTAFLGMDQFQPYTPPPPAPAP